MLTLVKSWIQLGAFENKARIEIIHLLLNYEIMSLSEICHKLNETYNRKLTLPGLLRHMRKLEDVGLVRQESGGFLPNPDARRRVYLIQGKERVEKILQSWSELSETLKASTAFSKLTRMARTVFSRGMIPLGKDAAAFEKLLESCESEEIYANLTEDEKKKLKFWKMMLATACKL